MASPTAISFNLRTQDEAMLPSAVMVSINEAQVCDHKFSIVHDEDCDGTPGSTLPLYFDCYFNPLDYEVQVDEEENGFGERKEQRKTIRRFASFDLVCDQLHQEYLYQYSALNNVKLAITGTAEVYDISEIQIERRGTLDGYLLELSVRFYFVREDGAWPPPLGLLSCCRPAYTDAPFVDPCPTFGEGDPGDIDCASFALVVSEAGGTLTATPSGAPGAVTTNWVYKENLGDNWSLLSVGTTSVSLGAYGYYKAIANSEGCTREDTFLYQDPCAGVSVTIREDGIGLVADVEGCGTPAFTWYEWDDVGEVWDEVLSGSGSYVPGAAGLFRVVMAGCDCTVEDIHDFAGASTCDFSVSLGYADNTLTPLVSACEEPAIYTYYLDTGSGPVVVQSGTEDEYVVTQDGLYILEVACGECVGTDQKVVLAATGCNLTLNIQVDEDNEAAVGVTGCGGEPITYTWFRNSGSGYSQVGTGNPFTLPGMGLYRLDVECGDCTVSQEFMHCPSEDTCKASEFFTGFSGFNIPITAFTLPDPASFSVDYIRERLWIFRNGQKITYDVGFNIDFANQEIDLTWEAFDEFIEVYWEDC